MSFFFLPWLYATFEFCRFECESLLAASLRKRRTVNLAKLRRNTAADEWSSFRCYFCLLLTPLAGFSTKLLVPFQFLVHKVQDESKIYHNFNIIRINGLFWWWISEKPSATLWTTDVYLFQSGLIRHLLEKDDYLLSWEVVTWNLFSNNNNTFMSTYSI